MSGLHQLIFRELGLCEAEVAEKCQRLVTGLEEMEVIDISPLLFLSFLLSLSLQNMVKPCSLQQGTAKPRWVGWPRQGGSGGQGHSFLVGFFCGHSQRQLMGTRPALPSWFRVPHHHRWRVLEFSSATDTGRTLGRSRQTLSTAEGS